MLPLLKQSDSRKIIIPGDFSSAAFFIVLGILLADNGLIIKDVGLNPTRTGLLDALKAMGAHIETKNHKTVSGEDMGDIFVKKSRLNAITPEGDIIHKMIDEIPILTIAALKAQGTTTIKDAKELTIKESNRIKSITTELTKMGAQIKSTDNGMIINGGSPLKGAILNSHNDHRIAMSLAIAAAIAEGESVIQDTDCTKVSFPNFFDILSRLLYPYAV
jgi:3-phosphoshikimate 1-carboxyvinyltransferase